jgi:mevalonate kinase
MPETERGATGAGYWQGVVDTILRNHDREMEKLRTEMRLTFQQYNTDMMGRINEMRGDLLQRSHEQKADILKALETAVQRQEHALTRQQEQVLPLRDAMHTLQGKLIAAGAIVAILLSLYNTFLKR